MGCRRLSGSLTEVRKKGYAGGLVRYGGWTFCISAHEAEADDMGVSFTVCRLRFLLGTMHGRRRRLMCRGSDVKERFGAFNLRV
jgi:hypothetical protein